MADPMWHSGQIRRILSALILAALASSALDAQLDVWEGPAAIAVEVRGDKGKPVEGATVTLQVADRTPPQGPPPVTTDANGRAVITNLSELEWYIEVRHESFMLYAAYIKLKAGKKPVVGFSSQVNTDSSWTPMRVKFAKAKSEFAAKMTKEEKRAERQRGKVERQAAQPRPEARQPAPVAAPPAASEPTTEAAAEAAPRAAPPPASPTTDAPRQPAPVAAQRPAPAEEPEAEAPAAEPPPAVAEEQLEIEPSVARQPEPDADAAAEAAAAALAAEQAAADQAEERAAAEQEAAERAAAERMAADQEAAEEDAAEQEATEKAAADRLAAEQETAEKAAAEAAERATAAREATEQAAAEREAAERAAADKIAADRAAAEALAAEQLAKQRAAAEAAAAETAAAEARAAEQAAADVEAVEPVMEPSAPAQPEPTAAPPITEAQPAPPVSPTPSAGPAPSAPRPIPSYLTAADLGTCPACKAGEWSMYDQETVPSSRDLATDDCPVDPEVVAAGIRSLVEAVDPAFAGPLSAALTPSRYAPVGREDRAAIRQQLGDYLQATSTCHLVGVLLPPGSSFSGYQYEAWGAAGGGACVAGVDCPVGRARWGAEPGLIEGPVTAVYALFHNRSTRHDRRAKFTVYFVPPEAGWAP